MARDVPLLPAGGLYHVKVGKRLEEPVHIAQAVTVSRHVRIAALVQPDPVNGRWPYDDPIRGLGLAKKGAKFDPYFG